MRTLLLSCVLLAGLVRADSVGVYAPAILPGVTLADNVWQKYEPAAFGSNTTARIQAFYDMMCERVDAMDPNYAVYNPDSDIPLDKTIISYPGCPPPEVRAWAAATNFPSVDQYRTLYTNMCAWLSRNPAVTPAANETDGSYLYPYWQSPLCYDIALSVTTNGIVSKNTDVYPCSLNRFGYAGVERHDISNALQAVANALGITYTVDTNGVTAADLDNAFCRFADPDTGETKYVDELVPTNAADAHPLAWAPLYAFDRICNDLSGRNVALIRPDNAYALGETMQLTTYTYNYDRSALASEIMSTYDGGGGSFYFSPTSITVTVDTYPMAAPSELQSRVGAAVRPVPARGTIGGDGVKFANDNMPAMFVICQVNEPSVELQLEPVCGPSSLIDSPQYLSRSRVTAVGSMTSTKRVGGVVDGVTTNTYHATTASSGAFAGDAARLCLSNAFVTTDEEVRDLFVAMSNSVGRLKVTVSGLTFSSVFAEGETVPAVFYVKDYTLPYLICENEYAFTGWSGHVAQPTDPLTVVGPQADYGDGDGGTDDFDVWVDATALASNADGSRERPFLTIDAAIEAVNPSGGAHAVTNRTPKIGIRKGTYEFPQYFRRTQGGDTPYAVRLIGIGPYVTIDKKKRGQSLGSDLSDSSRFSSLENLNFYVNYEGWGGRSFCAFVIVNCKFSGWYTGSYYAFIEGSYVLNSLFQDLTCYVREDDNVFIYGSEIEGCIFDGINATSDNRLVINMVSDISNSLILGGKWKEIGKNYSSYPHAFAHSTLYLPDVTTKTQPNATNCLFFIDGLTTTEDFRKHNVVTNTTLFATSIDPTTKTPTADYSDWKKLGFKGDTRTE